MTPCLRLKVDGDCGSITIGAILQFQYRVMGMKKPDGRVDPRKGTLKKLNAYSAQNKKPAPATFDSMLLRVQMFLKNHTPPEIENEPYSLIVSKKLVEADYVEAAKQLGVDVASIKAVAQVESLGDGFLSNGKPKILFEGHWFSNKSKRKYDKTHPTISFKSQTSKYYKGKEAEYSRYNAAKALDEAAAMESTSWGKFQIMGFNHKEAGYSTVQMFVKAMHVSEGEQLNAFINFIKSKGLDDALKSRRWVDFAKGYNGKKYYINKYDEKLKQAYTAFSARG